MEENENNNVPNAGLENKNDCGCTDGNCQPKKSNMVTKIIFAVIVVAAVGIIAVKLFHQPNPAAAKEAACKPGSSCCDTAKTAKCDTAKGSSCCPKSK